MPDEMTIPVLPCVSLSETIAFYRLMGFEATHKQSAPYIYLAMRRGGLHLHFHGREGLKPEESMGICLLVVPEVAPLHRQFVEALRGAYGKLPIAGIPRIARLRTGHKRFTMVDPSGNSIIFVQREDTGAEKAAPKSPSEPMSGLVRAIKKAEHLRDSKNDDALAAEVLDLALTRHEHASPIDRARALAARVELAVALAEHERIPVLREELQRILLTDDERERYREELEAADALTRTQQPASLV